MQVEGPDVRRDPYLLVTWSQLRTSRLPKFRCNKFSWQIRMNLLVGEPTVLRSGCAKHPHHGGGVGCWVFPGGGSELLTLQLLPKNRMRETLGCFIKDLRLKDARSFQLSVEGWLASLPGNIQNEKTYAVLVSCDARQNGTWEHVNNIEMPVEAEAHDACPLLPTKGQPSSIANSIEIFCPFIILVLHCEQGFSMWFPWSVVSDLAPRLQSLATGCVRNVCGSASLPWEKQMSKYFQRVNVMWTVFKTGVWITMCHQKWFLVGQYRESWTDCVESWQYKLRITKPAIPNLCLFTLAGENSRRAMPIARLKIQVPGWMFVFLLLDTCSFLSMGYY